MSDGNRFKGAVASSATTTSAPSRSSNAFDPNPSAPIPKTKTFTVHPHESRAAGAGAQDDVPPGGWVGAAERSEADGGTSSEHLRRPLEHNRISPAAASRQEVGVEQAQAEG